MLKRPNRNFRDESPHGGYEKICLREDLDVLTRNKPKSAAKLPAAISEPAVKQPKVFGITALLRFLIPLPFGRCATGCAELSFFLVFSLGQNIVVFGRQIIGKQGEKNGFNLII